jgi:ligand-binding SRPBCC domain-containing protein
MLPPFRLGLGGRLGSGSQWLSWIHLDDLVELFCFVLENDDVRGAINGVAPNPVTNAELTRELAHVLGRPAILPVPAAALKLAFGEMSAILLDSVKVQPAVAQKLGFRFKFDRLRAALDDVCSDLSHALEREQWLPHPIEEVFPFFADARNLERLTPDFLGFNVRGMSTKEIKEGTTINYSMRLHGLPVRWTSRIDQWHPNRSFVDSQTRGPYALWRHTHEFEPYQGGTIVRDRIRYRVPFGVLGELAAGAWVRSDLRRIFEYRRRQLMSLFPEEMAQKSWDEV